MGVGGSLGADFQSPSLLRIPRWPRFTGHGLLVLVGLRDGSWVLQVARCSFPGASPMVPGSGRVTGSSFPVSMSLTMGSWMTRITGCRLLAPTGFRDNSWMWGGPWVQTSKSCGHYWGFPEDWGCLGMDSHPCGPQGLFLAVSGLLGSESQILPASLSPEFIVTISTIISI